MLTTNQSLQHRTHKENQLNLQSNNDHKDVESMTCITCEHLPPSYGVGWPLQSLKASPQPIYVCPIHVQYEGQGQLKCSSSIAIWENAMISAEQKLQLSANETLATIASTAVARTEKDSSWIFYSRRNTTKNGTVSLDQVKLHLQQLVADEWVSV